MLVGQFELPRFGVHVFFEADDQMIEGLLMKDNNEQNGEDGFQA